MDRLVIGPPAIAILACLACADAAEDIGEDTVAVRDSAGIAIVENGSVEAAPVYQLGEPLLEIGSVDGPREYLLAGAGAVALLDDGGVAIGDRSRTIRFFGADGGYERTIGREGDGPGEFQQPQAIWQRDDGSLVVFDARHWRLTVIRDTQVVSTYPVRPPGMNPPGSIGRLDDGSLVVKQTVFSIHESGFRAMPVVVRRITLDGLPPDTVLEAEGGRMGPVRYSDGGSMVTSPLFEAPFVVSASGDAIYVSDCEEPRFRELSPDGELRRIVGWTTDDRTVGTEDVEAVRRTALADDETPEARQRTEESLDARPVNDLVPTCRDLRAGPDGTVWVQAFTSSYRSPTTWHVFEDGRLARSMRFPGSTFLVALGTDRFAVVQFGELDVERVRVYAMPR